MGQAEKNIYSSRIQNRLIKLTTSVDVNSRTGKQYHVMLGLCMEVVTGTKACWTDLKSAEKEEGAFTTY